MLSDIYSIMVGNNEYERKVQVHCKISQRLIVIDKCTHTTKYYVFIRYMYQGFLYYSCNIIANSCHYENADIDCGKRLSVAT